MLLAPALPRSLPIQLLGPLAGTKAEIESLQRALLNLSQATNRPDINPGPIDGVVGTSTVTAIIAGQTLISKELPSWAFLSLQAALAAGAMTSVAKEAVAAAAVPLTVAAQTAAVKYKVSPTTVPVMPSAGGFFAPGWWKTPAGLLLIGVAALVGYKLFLSSPSSPSKA